MRKFCTKSLVNHSTKSSYCCHVGSCEANRRLLRRLFRSPFGVRRQPPVPGESMQIMPPTTLNATSLESSSVRSTARLGDIQCRVNAYAGNSSAPQGILWTRTNLKQFAGIKLSPFRYTLRHLSDKKKWHPHTWTSLGQSLEAPKYGESQLCNEELISRNWAFRLFGSAPNR